MTKRKLDKIGGIKIPDAVMEVLQLLRFPGAGTGWIVGGTLRDALLGREAADWDLATTVTPENLMKIFPHAIPTGLKHGTITLVHHKIPIEITTLRKEADYEDGRRPSEVTFLQDIDEDLSRRDFTINAMAWDPILGIFEDPFDGQKDLALGILRAVGGPLRRLTEDGLRTLRAVRFVAQLGFEMDTELQLALSNSDIHAVFRKVAWERKKVEMDKLLMSGGTGAMRGLSILEATSLLDELIPELRKTVDCQQNKYHAYDVWKHTLFAVNHAPLDLALRWAALLHDVGKPPTQQPNEHGDFSFKNHEVAGAAMAEAILERFKCAKDFTAKIGHLVRHHLVGYNSQWSDTAIRRFVARVGQENVEDVWMLCLADTLAKGTDNVPERVVAMNEMLERIEEVMSRKPPVQKSHLAVSGAHIMGIWGIKPGPKVGEIKNRLFEHVLEYPEDNNLNRLCLLVEQWKTKEEISTTQKEIKV